MKNSLVKAGVSVALLALLFSWTSPKEMLVAASGVSLEIIAAVFLLNILVVAINCFRWDVLLVSQGVRVSFFRLFSYYLIGIFFNNFLPGGVGGDVYRVMGISEHFEMKEQALSSVFMERVMGLVVLVPISLAALVLSYSQVTDIKLILAGEAIMAGSLVTGIFILRLSVIKSLHFAYNPFFRLFRRFDLKNKAKSVYMGLSGFRDDKASLGAAVLLSFASRSAWIFSCYLLSSGMGHGLPLQVYFLVLPFVEFVRMFPVSINGLGFREGAFVVFFGAFGLGVSDSLAFSLIVYAFLLVLGIAGGILYGTIGWLTKDA